MAESKMNIEVKVIKSFYYHLICNLPKSFVERFGKEISYLLKNKVLLKTKINGKEENHTFKQIIRDLN